jgi:hypothetical protein
MITQLDTHQSLVETRSVKRFPYVILVFTSLSFVTSVFSMTEKVLPWGGRFWICFATATPFPAFVLFASFALSRNLGGRESAGDR